MKKFIIIAAIVVVVGLLVGITSFRVMEPSTKGVVVTLGKVRGEIGEGVHMVTPFVTRVYKYDLRTQQYNSTLQAYSKDTQTISYDISVMYVLDGAKISDIYRTIGSQIEERVAPLVAEGSKTVFSAYTADSIVSDRTSISRAMLERIKEMLTPYNIIVTEIAISNIDFSDEYEAAIERKQIASQDVLTEKHMLEKVEIQGEQAIAKAKADAEVQRVKESTLTEKILQQQAIDKWDGKMPTYYSGGELPFIAVQPQTAAPQTAAPQATTTP